MESFLEGSDTSQGSFMIRPACPETSALNITDEFGCIADNYLAQIKVEGSNINLVDSGSAITTIRKSDAEGIRQFSSTAVFDDTETLSNWIGVNNSRIPSLGTITADLEFGKWISPNCSIMIVPDDRPSPLDATTYSAWDYVCNRWTTQMRTTSSMRNSASVLIILLHCSTLSK